MYICTISQQLIFRKRNQLVDLARHLLSESIDCPATLNAVR